MLGYLGWGKILNKKNYAKEMVGYLTVDCGEDGVRHKLLEVMSSSQAMNHGHP